MKVRCQRDQEDGTACRAGNPPRQPLEPWHSTRRSLSEVSSRNRWADRIFLWF